MRMSGVGNMIERMRSLLIATYMNATRFRGRCVDRNFMIFPYCINGESSMQQWAWNSCKLRLNVRCVYVYGVSGSGVRFLYRYGEADQYDSVAQQTNLFLHCPRTELCSNDVTGFSQHPMMQNLNRTMSTSIAESTKPEELPTTPSGFARLAAYQRHCFCYPLDATRVHTCPRVGHTI